MNRWLEARNILAVRMDNMGDVVMLGPALRAIRETSTESRLTLLASPAGAQAAPLLPWVDDVIPWAALWQEIGDSAPPPSQEQELIGCLASGRFDAAIVFTSFSQTPHVPAYVCYLAGIPLRAGESKEFGGLALTDWARGAPDETHQVERNLRLVEFLGFRARDRYLAVAVGEAAREGLPGLLRSAGLDPARPYVLLHPGASARARRFPPEQFGEVARELVRLGWQVLVTGVEREAPLVQRVAATACGSLVGRTTLEEYAALVERASLVICNNTLPMHLSDAVRTPAVVLFAGTELEEQWRPRATRAVLLRRETPCSPCYLFECPLGHQCLDIGPDEVAGAAMRLLAADGGAPSGEVLRESDAARV